MKDMHHDAKIIINNVLAENMPQAAVVKALQDYNFGARVHLVAIGKAAWTMANAASEFLGDKVIKGIAITKYDHANGEIPNVTIYEAGHPVPDANTVSATQQVLAMVADLSADDEVLFLVSGGGSALFEAPQDGVSLDELAALTGQMLASGADIVEMNMIRKRLSRVKAGRFAEICAPAKIFAVVLSDVLGDRLDTIASRPDAPDMSTAEDSIAVVNKYNLQQTTRQQELLMLETPKQLDNAETVITGSVRSLCDTAAKSAKELGYNPYVLTTTLGCEAAEAGRFLAAIASCVANGRTAFTRPAAIIAGGETVVNLKGSGKGGRNQELTLSAATGISGLADVVLFALGSDGTDGPTDAAGGIVDGHTLSRLKEKGLNIDEILNNNDAYHGLQAIDGLIITGPTGTNVNDVAVVLVE